MNLNINDDIKFEMIETFIREMDFADGKINTIDGVRVTINGGWGLLRASNTSLNLYWISAIHLRI